jgi:hypothetical protein
MLIMPIMMLLGARGLQGFSQESGDLAGSEHHDFVQAFTSKEYPLKVRISGTRASADTGFSKSHTSRSLITRHPARILFLSMIDDDDDNSLTHSRGMGRETLMRRSHKKRDRQLLLL